MTLTHLPGVKLVDFSMMMKLNFVDMFLFINFWALSVFLCNIERNAVNIISFLFLV